MAEGKYEEGKGRAKEAAGEVTGNPDMEREGRVERTSGAAKEKASDLIDKVKGLFRRNR